MHAHMQPLWKDFAMHQKKNVEIPAMYKLKETEQSPVHGPSILRQEFLGSRFQSVIVPQIVNTDRSPSQRINPSLLNILRDAQAIETDTRRRNNRIMHDLKRDTINEIVRHNLESNPTSTTSQKPTIPEHTLS
jgi:hypothetical protein